MNKEKLSKIFEIYKELNKPEELEVKITISSTNLDKRYSINKKIYVILSPDLFVIKGDLSHLSKENLIKITDELKDHIDKEYDNLKQKLNNLRERF